MKTETRAARWSVRVGAVLLALVMIYIGTGLAAGMIPANRGWHAPPRGVRIFVESNGVHTGIIVPKVAAGIDWRAFARPGDLRDPRYAAQDHLAIGWGEKAFFLETPTWADVKLRTIVGSAVGSDDVLLHVEHLAAPTPGGDVRAVTLSEAEYRRLAGFIAATIRPGGRSYPGYDAYDAFYDARGHYSAVATCNAWTGDALRFAGVRVGWWTPFPATVMWWF